MKTAPPIRVGQTVTYDDGLVGIIVGQDGNILTVELPGGSLAYLHPEDFHTLNRRNSAEGAWS